MFADKSKEAQTATYADRGFRDAFRADLENPLSFINWERITLHEAHSDAVKRYEGLTVAELAREQGKDAVDALLDATLADDLRVEFTMASYNNRVDRMAELLNDPNILIGLGGRRRARRHAL